MFNNFFKFCHFALGDLCILPRLNSSICAGKVLGSRDHYCYLVSIFIRLSSSSFHSTKLPTFFSTDR